MTQPLNWGILGTSFISDVMADAIAAEGSTRIHAVAGRSVERLEQFATKHGASRTYTNYSALLKDPAVDVVYIALPNHLHEPYAIEAASAGKAILCEKSLSIDMPSTDAMLAAAQRNDVFLLEGLMYLTHPLAGRIAGLIRDGAIGEVRSVRGQYCAAISEFVNPASKGALYNLGCYPVSLMHLVLQQAFGDSIFAHANVSARGRRGADRNICESTAIFEFANPANADTVQCHLHTAEDYGLHAGFTVLGTSGSLELLSNPWLPEATNNLLSVAAYAQTPEVIEVAGVGDGFFHQVRLVRECLTADIGPLRPAARAQDSRAIMQLLTQWEAALS